MTAIRDPRESCWRVPLVARGAVSAYFSLGRSRRRHIVRVDKTANGHLFAPIISAIGSVEAVAKAHEIFPEAVAAAEPFQTCAPGIHDRNRTGAFTRSALARHGFA